GRPPAIGSSSPGRAAFVPAGQAEKPGKQRTIGAGGKMAGTSMRHVQAMPRGFRARRAPRAGGSMHRTFAGLAAAALAVGTVAVATIVPVAPAGAAPTELLFSEYAEGSAFNKAVEIYNGTGAPVHLAAA